MSVSILEARGLPVQASFLPKALTAASGVYCKVTSSEGHCLTTTTMEGVSPQWTETFKFMLKDATNGIVELLFYYEVPPFPFFSSSTATHTRTRTHSLIHPK